MRGAMFGIGLQRVLPGLFRLSMGILVVANPLSLFLVL